LYVSSGLGDEVVEAPRRALFDELFASDGDPIEKQLAYQRHSWPEAPHISVCMRRDVACTVSQTVVDVLADRDWLRYRPGPPDVDSTAVEVQIERRKSLRSL